MTARTTTSKNLQATVGLITLVLLLGLGLVALSHSNGYFDAAYSVTATFPTAGQNLDDESDVKVRGVTVGRVGGIDLTDEGTAQVTLRLNNDVRVPTTATAVIRPVSIFGPKFIDLVFEPEDLGGDLLAEGDEVAATRSATELGDAVGDVYRLIDRVEPGEIATIFQTLAAAGDGLAPELGRILTNGQQVVATLDGRAPELAQLLADVAALSETLASRAPGILTTAGQLHQVLPSIAAREDGLDTFLRDATLVADDLAGLLDRNRDALGATIRAGANLTGFTYERRASLIPGVLGLSASASGFDAASREGVPGVDQLIFAQFNLPLNPCTGLGIRACGGDVVHGAGGNPDDPTGGLLTEIPTIYDTVADPLAGLFEVLAGLTPLVPPPNPGTETTTTTTPPTVLPPLGGLLGGG